MSDAVDMERDELLRLVTDALQAGPGTPRWHDALEAIKTQGTLGGDAAALSELQLLMTARQRLESGKGYRAIHAGDGFTRRLMRRIDNSGGGSGFKLPTANTLALISATAVVVLLALLAWRMLTAVEKPSLGLDQLGSTAFMRTVQQVDFTRDDSTRVKLLGPVAMQRDRGLAIAARSAGAGTALLAEPVDATGATQVLATVRLHRLTAGAAVQVLVAESGAGPDAAGFFGRELLCWLSGSQVRVLLPGGRGVAIRDLPTLRAESDIELRMLLGDTHAIVEVNGTRIWSGEHELGAGASRQVGVRLLAETNERPDALHVRSLRVSAP